MAESLAVENDRLRAELGLLQETLNQLKSGNPGIGIGNGDEEVINTAEEGTVSYNYNEPESVAHHSHFDESIRHYFDRSENIYYDEKEEVSETIAVLGKELEELNYNILYENLFRLGGITAFPLNKQILADEELLGLRIDLFSVSSRKYLTPHYVILRKVPRESKLAGQNADSSKWMVYRHTLPVFVPIEEYSKVLDLEDSKAAVSDFARKVRSNLLHLNYKHDKFETLRSFRFSDFGLDTNETLVSKLEKDLQCSHVKIVFSLYLRGHLELELVCNLWAIETAILSSSTNELNEADKFACESILRNSSLTDLLKSFRKLSELLLRKQLSWKL